MGEAQSGQNGTHPGPSSGNRSIVVYPRRLNGRCSCICCTPYAPERQGGTSADTAHGTQLTARSTQHAAHVIEHARRAGATAGCRPRLAICDMRLPGIGMTELTSSDEDDIRMTTSTHRKEWTNGDVVCERNNREKGKNYTLYPVRSTPFSVLHCLSAT